MAVSAELVMQLREKTGVSVMECKKALDEAGGDMAKALAILSTRAASIAEKKSDRTLGAGVVSSYIHQTREVGALVLLSCETDFVAKNEDFIKLAYDVAMHVAAMRPQSEEELLAQPYIKDGEKTIADLLSLATQRFGERVKVTGISVFNAR